MTLYIPLDASAAHPNSPPFLVPSPSPEANLTSAIQAILQAKRIAVVCGAGISVEAGIPDFRSQDGLFQSLKRDNPKEALSSGKDLFDASVFKSQQKTTLFYQMIARLSSLSSQGQPTAFHQLLRTLDDRGQLLRVYTQNIDALEMKAGLSFGVPEFEEKKLRVNVKGKSKAKAKAKARETGSGAYKATLGGTKGKRSATAVAAPSLPTPPNELETSGAGPSTPPRRATPSCPSPAVAVSRLNVIPRCIPLHGTLLTLHCQHCTQSFPLYPPLHPADSLSPPPSPILSTADSMASLHSLLALGTPPPCPSCESLEETRALVGKRPRGVGKLRPSVVLYGEEHREGEGVGEVVRRDLCGFSDVKSATSPDKVDASSPSKSRVRAGKGPDLLLVVGTSLRVPGTKRIVREFSKAVRPFTSPTPSRLPTPTSASPPAPDASPAPAQIRTVYLNFEFPLPAREWEGVFDVWVNGDAQAFAKAMVEAIEAEEVEVALKKPRSVSKGKADAGGKTKTTSKGVSSGKTRGKRKAELPETPTRPTKRRRVTADLPPTPVSLPKNGRAKKRERVESLPHTPVRRVILRLPPRPAPPPPNKSPLKRTRSIPEVVISTKSPRFSRKPVLARSLSPLTSLTSSSSGLSSLTPPPPSTSEPISFATSATAVSAWRRNVKASPDKDIGGELSDEEEDVPLSVALSKRTRESCHVLPRGRPPVKYTYNSRGSHVHEDHFMPGSASE